MKKLRHTFSPLVYRRAFEESFFSWAVAIACSYMLILSVSRAAVDSGAELGAGAAGAGACDGTGGACLGAALGGGGGAARTGDTG